MTRMEHLDVAFGGVRRRALVAAPDAAAQSACRSALEGPEWDVAVVDTGVAAVISARETVPAFIIMDLQLRDVPGREAMEWIRSNPELLDVPVVLIAGAAEGDDDVAEIAPAALLRRPVTSQAVRRIAAAF